MFVRAERKRSKARLAISGPSGSGKTFSALLLAKGLGGKTAVLDTENGSASLYSHLVDFDVMELSEPYSPERYIEVIRESEKAKYDNLIMDSITPEWSGSGGILQLNQQIADAKFRGNTWSAWSETDPRHRRFVDAQLQSNLNIIATMRSKTETAQEKDERTGKTKVVQLGMKSEQRDSIIYEYTAVLDLTHEKHYATAIKDRTGLFMNKDPMVISEQTGKMIRSWLDEGIEPTNPEILKTKAKVLAAALDEATDTLSIDSIILTNSELMQSLHDELPEWYERLGKHIAKVQEAFLMAAE